MSSFALEIVRDLRKTDGRKRKGDGPQVGKPMGTAEFFDIGEGGHAQTDKRLFTR